MDVELSEWCVAGYVDPLETTPVDLRWICPCRFSCFFFPLWHVLGLKSLHYTVTSRETLIYFAVKFFKWKSVSRRSTLTASWSAMSAVCTRCGMTKIQVKNFPNSMRDSQSRVCHPASPPHTPSHQLQFPGQGVRNSCCKNFNSSFTLRAKQVKVMYLIWALDRRLLFVATAQLIFRCASP